jgi:hypothetical protein
MVTNREKEIIRGAWLDFIVSVFILGSGVMLIFALMAR